jgi:hypothetical protein
MLPFERQTDIIGQPLEPDHYALLPDDTIVSR